MCSGRDPSCGLFHLPPPPDLHLRVKGDLSDILLGHNTWTTYHMMLRVFKHYDFGGLSDSRAVGRRVSMSSYPGALSSIDDFYILGAPSHMVVMVSAHVPHHV